MSKILVSLIEDKVGYYDFWFVVFYLEFIYEVEICFIDWFMVDGVNNSLSILFNNISFSFQFILVGSLELIFVFDSEVGDFRDMIWIRLDDIFVGIVKCEKW